MLVYRNHAILLTLSVGITKPADGIVSNARFHLIYMCLHRCQQLQTDHQVAAAFNDGYPVLMLGDASMADLNSKTPEYIPEASFRPNVSRCRMQSIWVL